MISSLKTFFSAVHGSMKGILVPEDLYRSLLTSLGSGTIVGLVILLIQSVVDHATTIFPNPTVATLVSMLLTLVIDLLRRQSQGTTPAPVPNPAPVPSPAPAPQTS